MTDAETNSLGMELVRVPAGTFRMGRLSGAGHTNELPAREVTVSRPFSVARTPVTNAQFEAFDATHRERRGARGLSTGDDEAAVCVSWHDAVAFCEWLAAEEDRPYRLPTEAEWEYACRAGTETPYHAGEELPEPFHRHQEADWHPTPVDLTVGETPANDWGLCDVHGLVEEWCHDWYGPYPDRDRTDPVGHATGVARVTRGGSHNTPVEYLRSASRAGTLPADRQWLVGFRPVVGPLPESDPYDPPDPPRWARDDRDGDGATGYDWPAPDFSFAGPQRFVRDPVDDGVPMGSHNHCPAVTYCDDGSLLAVWFSCEDERDREMTILASRLRPGADAWDPPTAFFDVPGRNLTGSALLHDGGTLRHFNGLEVDSHWANLAVVSRSSTDGGRTWTAPEFVDPAHRSRNQVIAGPLRTGDGDLLLPCDAHHTGRAGTAIHVSPDDGRTWRDPGRTQPKPDYRSGATGGTIAGIHAGVAELSDGRLLALGRGVTVDGRMPASVSTDGGDTWTYAASPFPPLDSGQRLVLRRLPEGPLLLATFTDPSDALDDPAGMELVDGDGERGTCFGLFAALSYDDGETWPVRRLVSPGGSPREYDGGAWTGGFTLDATRAEPRGYLAATRTPDGVIHLLSSALHYRFTLSWLEAAAE